MIWVKITRVCIDLRGFSTSMELLNCINRVIIIAYVDMLLNKKKLCLLMGNHKHPQPPMLKVEYLADSSIDPDTRPRLC